MATWASILQGNPSIRQSGASLTRSMTVAERAAFRQIENDWFAAASGCDYSQGKGDEWREWQKEEIGVRLIFYADTMERSLSDNLPTVFGSLGYGYDCRNNLDEHAINGPFLSQMVNLLASVKDRLAGRHPETNANAPLWWNTVGKWQTAVSGHYAQNLNNDVEFSVATANPGLVTAGKELTGLLTPEEVSALKTLEAAQLASEAKLGVDLQPGERQHDFDNWTKTYYGDNPGYRLLSYEGLIDYPQLYPPSLNASYRYPKYKASSAFPNFISQAVQLLRSVRGRLNPAPTVHTDASGVPIATTPQKSSTAFIFLLLLAAVFLLSKDKKLKL